MQSLLIILVLSSFVSSVSAQAKQDEQNCLLSPKLYNFDIGAVRTDLFKHHSQTLEEKGYRILTYKEFKQLRKEHKEQVIFELGTGYFYNGSISFYGPNSKKTTLLKLWKDVSPRPKQIIVAPENKPIKETITKLEAKLKATQHASEIVKIQAEIKYWKDQYNPTIDIVIPAQTQEEAFLESIPKCSEVN